MPAIASLEDLRAAQKDLQSGIKRGDSVLSPRYSVLMKAGWKNICKLWLGERTPEELKGGRD
jgi:hypothetical protein